LTLRDYAGKCLLTQVLAALLRLSLANPPGSGRATSLSALSTDLWTEQYGDSDRWLDSRQLRGKPRLSNLSHPYSFLLSCANEKPFNTGHPQLRKRVLRSIINFIPFHRVYFIEDS
jgi:hypothetical protein